MSPTWLNDITRKKYFDTAKDILNRLNSYAGNRIIASKSYENAKPIDTQPVDKRSEKFLTQALFDSIEYDSVHLWFCTLAGAPAPFNKWFPAQRIDEPSKGVAVSSMSFGLEEVNTLNNYNSINLRTELLDDSDATLEQFLRKWQKDCSKEDYSGFRYLPEILSTLTVTKYNWQKDKIYAREFYVLPSGSITSEHGNEPSVKNLNVNFAVFGFKELEESSYSFKIAT